MKDTQNRKDQRQIPIQEVGISGLPLPLRLKVDGMVLDVDTTLKIACYLNEEQKGIHMSRFVRKFDEYDGEILDIPLLMRIARELREWEESCWLRMEIETKIYLGKKTPVTGINTYSRYPLKLIFESGKKSMKPEEDRAWVEVGVFITSLCPASKENSKYGAHNQRGLIEVKIKVDDHPDFNIEELIKSIEEESSCEIYECLKLEDEKYVTERAYENPKFVEDLGRDIVLSLEERGYHEFEVKITIYESIHEHNAYCVVQGKDHDKR